MNKKTNIMLEVIAKIDESFPETTDFINKVYSEACSRENMSIDEAFLSLIIDVIFFLL